MASKTVYKIWLHVEVSEDGGDNFREDREPDELFSTDDPEEVEMAIDCIEDGARAAMLRAGPGAP